MNIMELLAQATGQVPPVEAPADAPDEEIVVQGGRPPAILRDSIRQEVPYVERDPIPANSKSRKELIERRGMFGLKGGLRDIVGVLGDAFLTQAGRPSEYGPRREREKLASDLYGFTGNPQAAIERVVVNNPDIAIDLEKDRQAGLYRQAAADAQRAAISQKGTALIGSLARTIKDGATWEKGKPILARMAGQYGVDIGDLPDAYDPSYIDALVTRGLTPDQGVDNERADSNAANQEAYRTGQLTVAQQRAAEAARHNSANEAIARQKAARAPAGRAAPNPTAASIAAPILAKLERGEQITQGQAAVLNRLGMTPDRGQGKSKKRGIPPLPPGFNIRKAN